MRHSMCWNLIILITCCLSGAMDVAAQELTLLTTDYYDVQFLDDQTVIASGSNGNFSLSSDAGATWETISTDWDSHIFWSIDFIDRNRGWAAGTGGMIIETMDGGRSWTQIREPEGEQMIIHHLAMSSSGIGVAVGRPGLILRTDDFGQSWAEVGQDLNFPIMRVELLANDNFAACGFATVLYSDDKGLTWSDIEFEYEGNPASLFWQSSASDGNGNVYLSGAWGAPGFILHSSNGGETWVSIATPGGTTALAADGTTLLFPQGTTEIQFSANSGDTWDAAALSGAAIAVPDFQLVARAAAIRGSNALVLTERNGILRSTDGGASWQTQSFLPSTNIWTGLFTENDEIHVAGGNSLIAESVDGGDSWMPSTLDGLEQPILISKMVAVDQNVKLAAGSRGTVLRQATPGGSWTRVLDNSDLGIVFTSIEFDDQQSGLAVGTDPTQLITSGWVAASTSDGGNTWDSSPVRRFNEEFVPSAVLTLGDGRWIVAGADRSATPNGQIALSSDDGDTWEYLDDVAPGVSLRGISRLASETVIVVGDGGVILRSVDNGDTWTRIESGVDARLNDVDFVNANLGIAVGEDVVLFSSDSGVNWTVIADLPGDFSGYSIVYRDWNRAAIFGPGFGVARLNIDAVTDVQASVEQGSAAPRVWMRPIVPNPVNDIVRTAVYFRSSVPLDQIKVRVFSYMGAEVLDVSNSFIYQSPQQGFRHGEFSTAQLGNGVYLLNITDGQFNHTLSFVVMKR